MGHKRLVIIGANSFLGRTLAKQARNRPLIPLTRQNCDLATPDAVDHLAKNIGHDDSVVFLASLNRKGVTDAGGYLANLSMAAVVAEAMDRARPARFTFTSTVDVYGSAPQGRNGAGDTDARMIDESDPANPEDLYSLSKAASEELFTMVCQHRDIPLCVLRLPGLYGAEDPHPGVVTRFARTVLDPRAREIVINQGGEDVRYSVCIEDVARAILQMEEKGAAGLYNLVGDQPFRVLDLVHEIQTLLGRNLPVQVIPATRPPVRILFNTGKFRKTLPDFAFCSLEETLKAFTFQAR